MKHTLIVLMILLFCRVASAQVTNLTGSVTDSLMNPLAYVTIIATPIDVNESIQFTATKVNGKFNLELLKDTPYSISVSLLGFKKYDFDFTPTRDTIKKFQLVEDVTQLDEVVVEFELPISIKKDTIIYNVDSFVTGEERKLKDVLNKLPGIEVDENGTVTSQGKKITHVMVEDKSFFGGSSKLATDNIPANAVDNIEIIDDYNEVSFLKGMTNNDNIALNIMLKKGKKNFLFGDIRAGKGNASFYEGNTNLFYYSPNLSLNFIGGFNNTGKSAFNSRDYQNFTGGPSTIFNPRDVAEEQDIIEAVEVTDVISSESKVGALNIVKAINDKVEFSSYLIYSSLRNKTLLETNNEYILPDSTFFENLSNNGNTDKKQGLGSIKFKYLPNKSEQWSIDFLTKGIKNNFETALLSTIDSTEQSFKSFDDSDAVNLNGNLEWHKKISNQHATSFNSNIEYDENFSDVLWNTNRLILSGLVPLSISNNYTIALLRKEKKTNINFIGKHYWSIDKSNLLHITIGYKYRNHDFLTNDSQILDREIINNFENEGFGNNVDFKWNDFYSGIYFNSRMGEFEFQPSVFLHNFSWSVSQTSSIHKNKWVFLPELSIRRRSNSTGGLLRLDSSLKSSFSDINDLTNNFYLQSYNSVKIGDENLENELSHHTSFTYSRSSLLRGLYILGVVNYVYRINGITSSVITQNQDRILSPIRLRAPNQSFNGTIILKKSTENLKYGLTTNFNASKSSQQINRVNQKYKNITGSYKISAKTINQRYPVIELGFEQSVGNYGTDISTFNFVTQEPFVSLDYDFLKKFVFSFDYKYFNYVNKTANINNNFSLSNASFAYVPKDSPWNLELSIQNLFDIKFKNENSFDVFIVSDQNTFILPRIAILSLTYQL